MDVEFGAEGGDWEDPLYGSSDCTVGTLGPGVGLLGFVKDNEGVLGPLGLDLLLDRAYLVLDYVKLDEVVRVVVVALDCESCLLLGLFSLDFRFLFYLLEVCWVLVNDFEHLSVVRYIDVLLRSYYCCSPVLDGKASPDRLLQFCNGFEEHYFL